MGAINSIEQLLCLCFANDVGCKDAGKSNVGVMWGHLIHPWHQLKIDYHGHDVAHPPQTKKGFNQSLSMYKWGTPVREKTRWMGHELEDGNQNNMSNQHTSKISPSMLAIEVSIKGHACSESYGYQLAGCEGCPKKKVAVTLGRPWRRIYTVHLKASSGILSGWKPFSFHVFAGLCNIVVGPFSCISKYSAWSLHEVLYRWTTEQRHVLW